MSPETLILPRYLVPVRPRGIVLENHGVLVRGDRIHTILQPGEASEARNRCAVVDLPRHVLMPGFINMHTHSPMTLLRGYADDLDLQLWLNEHIWPAESRHVDHEFVTDGTRLAIAEMLRSGTTCFNDNYFYPDAMADAAVEAGMRAMIGLPLLDQATCWAGSFEEYESKGLAVADRHRGEALVAFSLAPHAPYSVSDPGLARIAQISGERGMRVHMHCLETRYDIEHSRETYGLSPLDRLNQFGLISDSAILVHMTQLGSQDISLLADCGTHVVHCPQSNLKLASGICLVAALVAAGVNVSIGTDGAASNNNLDLLEEARFAALLAKGASQDATALGAVEVLDLLTINGAAALGLEAEIGSIEAGKQADLCAMDLAHPQTVPLHNVHSQVVYAASSAQFSDVWVAGVRLMEGRQLLTVDEPAILDAAEQWRLRLGGEPGARRVAS